MRVKGRYPKIISALLATPTITEAAKRVGVSSNTLYALLDDEEFSRQYENAQEKLLQQTTGFLAHNLSLATENIVEIADNKKYPPAVRVNACRTILEFGIKYTETANVLKRIKALEAECGIDED